MQRTIEIARDEAALAADEILRTVPGAVEIAGSAAILEEAVTPILGKTRRFTPSVDRRVTLRAR